MKMLSQTVPRTVLCLNRSPWSKCVLNRRFSSLSLQQNQNFSKHFLRENGLKARILSHRHFSITVTKWQETNESSVNLVADATTNKEPVSNEIVLDFLPEKPAPIEGLAETTIKYVGDPPFEALGLASWWPTGRMQYFMEYLHVDLDLPWWSTIIAMTVVVRMCTFPLVVMSQRNAAKMSNTMPKMMEIQQKMTDARARGDVYDSAKYGMELQNYMTKHKIHPLKNMVPMLVQAPIFISMFTGLRGMANLPVESMCTGGLYWFTDLTVCDPFYLLPLMTSTTLFLQLKLGADGVSFNHVGPIIGKVLKYGLPSFVFIATMNFPAVSVMYCIFPP